MATASEPSRASPTTSMSGSVHRHIRSADRINGSSSATITVIARLPPTGTTPGVPTAIATPLAVYRVIHADRVQPHHPTPSNTGGPAEWFTGGGHLRVVRDFAGQQPGSACRGTGAGTTIRAPWVITS